ncbi:MAG TPA: DUF4337 domain-containing protein [Flavisolibacter sp.]|nr:DUF4337 domain-containing protein [Flavisolibacter sp.]
MEEIEVPTEHLSEEINERAEEAKKDKRWSFYVAISTALMAVFAAISSLMAGHHSNEALIEQIKASDQWNYYQAKGIKAEILSLNSKGVQDTVKLKKYNKDQQDIRTNAEDHEKQSEGHLQKHIILARSVTLFQIAIAISAISILTEKRPLWFFSIILTLVGLVFFVANFI